MAKKKKREKTEQGSLHITYNKQLVLKGHTGDTAFATSAASLLCQSHAFQITTSVSGQRFHLYCEPSLQPAENSGDNLFSTLLDAHEEQQASDNR